LLKESPNFVEKYYLGLLVELLVIKYR